MGRVTIKKAIVLISFITLAVFSATEISAMAWDFKLDLNSHIENTTDLNPSPSEVKGDLPPLSFGVFSGNYRNGNSRSRYGVVFRHSAATPYFEAQAADNFSSSVTSVQFGYGQLVKRWSKADLSLELYGGPAFLNIGGSEDNPDAGWKLFNRDVSFLFSPGVHVVVPLNSYWSGLIGFRMSWYLGEKDFGSPFNSGVVFSIGFQVGKSQDAPGHSK